MADNPTLHLRSEGGTRAFWFVFLRIPEFFVASLLGILIIFIAISVFSRYVLNIGMPWSDEVARLLFIWIVYVGFAIGVRHRGQVTIDWAIGRLSFTTRRMITALQDLLIFLFSAFFLWQSMIIVKFSFLQRLPELEISIAWMYFALAISAVLMTIYAAANLWETLREKTLPKRDEDATHRVE